MSKNKCKKIEPRFEQNRPCRTTWNKEESEKQKGATSFRTIRREKRTWRRNVVVLSSDQRICDFEPKKTSPIIESKSKLIEKLVDFCFSSSRSLNCIYTLINNFFPNLNRLYSLYPFNIHSNNLWNSSSSLHLRFYPLLFVLFFLLLTNHLPLPSDHLFLRSWKLSSKIGRYPLTWIKGETFW